MAIHWGYVRVPVQRTKAARECGLALERQILIAEKDDAMLEQRAPNVFDHLFADLVEVNTCDFSAQGRPPQGGVHVPAIRPLRFVPWRGRPVSDYSPWASVHSFCSHEYLHTSAKSKAPSRPFKEVFPMENVEPGDADNYGPNHLGQLGQRL